MSSQRADTALGVQPVRGASPPPPGVWVPPLKVTGAWGPGGGGGATRCQGTTQEGNWGLGGWRYPVSGYHPARQLGPGRVAPPGVSLPPLKVSQDLSLGAWTVARSVSSK